MQKVSVVTPLSGFSARLDAGIVDPSTSIGKLTAGLGASDSFQVYGTLDPSATAASLNLTPLCILRGTAGEAGIAKELRGWRFFFLNRLSGSGNGFFDVSGDLGSLSPSAPASVALPAALGFALLPLTAFRNSVLIALDASQTSSDVFNVYGTDDPTSTSQAGATLIGQISGGGETIGQVGNSSGILVDSYENVLIQRVSGVTPGSAFAWGNSDAGSAVLNGNTITYQPGGTANPQKGIYTSWATAFAEALFISPNNPTIVVDASFGSPVVPAGTYAVPATLSIVANNLATLTLQDGAHFTDSGVTELNLYGVQIDNQSTTAPFWSSPNTILISMFNAANISSDVVATKAFLALSSGALCFLSLGTVNCTLSGAAAAAIVSVASGATLDVWAGSDASVGANSVTGAGTIVLSQENPTASISTTQTGASGAFSIRPILATSGITPTPFFKLAVPLTGGTSTVASGKNLTRATLVGVYLTTPTTAVGVPVVTFVAAANGNVTVTSYGPAATQLGTDASTYTCVFAGAY